MTTTRTVEYFVQGSAYRTTDNTATDANYNDPIDVTVKFVELGEETAFTCVRDSAEGSYMTGIHDRLKAGEAGALGTYASWYELAYGEPLDPPA